jgi:dienelactone hydrolase
MIRFNTQSYVNNMERQAEAERRFDYHRPLETGSWTEWRESFRSGLRDILGLPLIRQVSLPLQPRCVESKSFPHYTREKWYIATEPGLEIPFYLLLPNAGNRPYPLVLTPHGHGTRGKESYVGEYASEKERVGTESADRDIALQAVSEGYAVIAPDVRAFNEMARTEEMDGRHTYSCVELQRRAIMYGRTLIGERVHDMGRLIDYATTRSDIDTSRIVITGNSGGGTVSLFAAALDERISIAVPGSYFCTFYDSIIAVPHCPCNLVPGIMQLGEMYDVAGLIAPRPILAVHGVHDKDYPIEGTRRAFAHLKEIYRANGYPNRCELYEGSEGHRYYKDRVWSFVREHLDTAHRGDGGSAARGGSVPRPAH